MIIRNALIATLLFVAVAGANDTRWAVVSTEGEQAAAFSQLVSAQLSKKGIPPLRADEQPTTLDKRSIKGLFKANGNAVRAACCKRVSADMLLVLDLTGDYTDLHLNAMITDTRFGLRLGVFSIPMAYYQGAKLERIATNIASIVADYHNHFEGGVKGVVSASPFKAAKADAYDSLGEALQTLCINAQAQHPGVAVLPPGDTQWVDGSQLPVLLINGRYQHNKETVTVNLTLSATRSGKNVCSATETIPLNKVASRLGKLSSGIRLVDTDNGKALTDKRLITWLAGQAELYRNVNMFEKALSYREAVLLAAPAMNDLRVKLLDDYSDACQAPYNIPEDVIPKWEIGKQAPSKEQIDREFDCYFAIANRRVGMYLRALEHLIFMVEKKQFDKATAARLISDLRATRLSTSWVNSHNSPEDIQRNKALLLQAEDAEFTMHKTVLSKLDQLKTPEDWGERLPIRNLPIYLEQSYIERLDHRYKVISKKQVDECLYYFNSIISDTHHLNSSLNRFFAPGMGEGRRIRQESTFWSQFLEALEKSPRQISQCLGEYGQIQMAMWQFNTLTKGQRKQLDERIRKLIVRWTNLPKEDKYHRREEENPYIQLERDYVSLTGKEWPKSARKAMQFERPEDWRTNKESWQYWGTPEMLGKLRFTKLAVSPGGLADIPADLKAVPGSISKDLLWNSDGIYELKKSLELSAFVSGFNGWLKDARADSMHVWIIQGPTDYSYNDSLSVYDLSGRKVAGIRAIDLPEHNRFLNLIITGDNSALLAGGNTATKKWIARAILSEGKLSISQVQGKADMAPGQLFGKGRFEKYGGILYLKPTKPGKSDNAATAISHVLQRVPYPFYSAESKKTGVPGSPGVAFIYKGEVYSFNEACWHVKNGSFNSLVAGKLPEKCRMASIVPSSHHGIIGLNGGQFYRITISDKHLWTEKETEK